MISLFAKICPEYCCDYGSFNKRGGPIQPQTFNLPPDNKAGANERDGFIDAPDINAKKSISKPTIPPITIAPKPLKPLV